MLSPIFSPSFYQYSGSDFYVGKLTETLTVDGENDESETQTEDIEVTINLQMWDTPGRERFYYNKRKQQQTTASLADPFLAQADACMLVYDMTSSTSFTQLLRWYADLMEIIQNHQKQRQQQNQYKEESKASSHHHHYHRADFPILIVGNKLDLFQATQQRASTLVHPRRVPQRDVLGLHGKNFKGKDFQYEYRVSPIKSPRGSSSSSSKSNHHRRARRPSKRQEVSSFLANRENWTKDNSYLDSLLNSEDLSHPDQDLVQLWCMRNGLEHLEVSAATGQGVEHAIVTLARMALERKLDMEYQQQEQEIQLQQQQEQQKEEEQQRQEEQDQQQFLLVPPNATLSPLDEHESEQDESLVTEQQQQQQASLDVHQPKWDLQERYRSKDANGCCFGFLPLPQGLFRKRLHNS